jgi:hypothetical protein
MCKQVVQKARGYSVTCRQLACNSAMPQHPKAFEFYVTLISCTLTFGVILSFLVFPKMWSKIFMRIILYAAISVFIANATVFSNSPDDYYLCAFQGVFQQFFYPASWIWTTILSYLLYCLVMYGKIEMEELKIHLFGWGIPLLTTTLPLTTSKYSRDADDDGFCWLNSRGDIYNRWTLFWQGITFAGVAFTCTLLMAYWGARMYYKIRIQKSECSPAVVNAMNTLFIYPFLIVFCWLPEAMQNVLYPGYSAHSHVIIGVTSLAISQGGFSAIAFFVNSKETRTNWLNLFITLFPFCAGVISPVVQVTEATPDRPTLAYAGEDFEEDDVYTGKSESYASGVARMSTTMSPMGAGGNHGNDIL